MRRPLLAATAFTLLLLAHIATVLSLVSNTSPKRGSMHPSAAVIILHS